MFKRALITLLKLTVFIALVWVVVAVYWAYTDHVVAPEDLLVYFVILPGSLLCTYFLARMVWTTISKNRGAATVPATTVEGDSVADGSRFPGRDKTSAPATYVLAHAISTYFGDESERFLLATLQDRMRADIDAAFTQEFGYGVRVAGVEELELASPPEGARVTVMRTCALLKRIYVQLESLLVRTAPNAETMNGTLNEDRGVRIHPEWRGAMRMSQSSDQPAAETVRAFMPNRLGVHIVLPAFLIPTELSLIQTQILSWLERSGWPTEALSVITIQPEDETTYFRVLQDWQQAPVFPDANEWLLILSATSWLDTDLLNDKLYKEPHFAGQMAKGDGVIGELACGIVLTRVRPAAELELEPYIHLSVISSAQCSKPVDAKGTVESNLLNEMLAEQQAGLSDPAQPVRGLVTSGNLNNRRIIELGRWATDSLPQLDFIEDILCVGEHIGECEPAGSLLALTLASAMVQQREGSVLFCANQHPDWRMLASLRPAT